MTPCYPKMVPLATQKEFGPILKTCPPGRRERCTCAKNQQCSTALWQVRRRARLQQRLHRMHPDRACSCLPAGAYAKSSLRPLISQLGRRCSKWLGFDHGFPQNDTMW